MGISGSGQIASVSISGDGGVITRPVYVLARVGLEEFIGCQLTSLPFDDFTAIPLDDSDFEEGLLGRPAFIRPRRIVTLSTASVERICGRVNQTVARQVTAAAISFLKNAGDFGDDAAWTQQPFSLRDLKINRFEPQ